MNSKIICCDLDGTLLSSDMLIESFLFKLKKNPFVIFLCFWWLIKGGKLLLKQKLAENYVFSPEIMPYNQHVLDYVKQQKEAGAKLYLVTGTYISIADKIAQYLGIFDGWYGSSEENGNLIAENKATLLKNKFKDQDFCYIGNSKVDIPVWKIAKEQVIVSYKKRLIKKVKKIVNNKDIETLEPSKITLKNIRSLLRIHQWSKNLLLFTAIIPAGLLFDVQPVVKIIMAFFSFSCLSSFVYILNDLMDLNSDRKHFEKKFRALPSGRIPLIIGISALPVLLLISISIGYFVSKEFLLCLFIYFVVTNMYSFWLKRIAIMDCMILSFLYTFRVITGGIVINIFMSKWFLAFASLIFLSLACLKRFSELRNLKIRGKKETSGRGYIVDDINMIFQMGLSTGIASILLFILYIFDPAFTAHASMPVLATVCIYVLLYWICYMFFKASRGNMYEDPVLFAVKDRNSLILGFIFVLFYILAVEL